VVLLTSFWIQKEVKRTARRKRRKKGVPSWNMKDNERDFTEL